MGLGSLGFERWGRALVFAVTGGPFGSAGDALVAAILQGAVQRAWSREVTPLFLHREGERARFLATTRTTAQKIQQQLESGVQWGEALTRIQAGAA